MSMTRGTIPASLLVTLVREPKNSFLTLYLSRSREGKIHPKRKRFSRTKNNSGSIRGRCLSFLFWPNIRVLFSPAAKRTVQHRSGNSEMMHTVKTPPERRKPLNSSYSAWLKMQITIFASNYDNHGHVAATLGIREHSIHSFHRP